MISASASARLAFFALMWEEDHKCGSYVRPPNTAANQDLSESLISLSNTAANTNLCEELI